MSTEIGHDRVSVPELILAQARLFPDTVAVESGGDSLTYAQVAAQACSLAAHLHRMSTGPGDLVAVALPRGVDLIPTLIGVQLAGAAYVPLDPEHPADRLSYILDDAGARILITTDARSTVDVRADRRVHLEEVAVLPEPPVPPMPAPHSLAYAIYTSGSTGRPKGVLVTHAALTNLICSMQDRPGLPREVVLPAITTVSFDIAGLELFLPLTTGGRVVVARQHETADPRQLASLLERTAAKVLQATPVTWRLLLEAGWTPPPGFTVLCGGERLPGELADRLLGEGVVLWDLYGPTETTIWSALTRYERDAPIEYYPVTDTSLRVLNERLMPVGTGVPGELYIGGAGLAVGYLGRAALTAERFVADPAAGATGTRLYRTGDMARRNSNGQIEILGRVDDQIKLRGFRIEPGEIETVLAEQPGVAEAAVRAIGGTGEAATRLVGYVRAADPTDPPDPTHLRHQLARAVPSYMIPSQFVILDEFPRTCNGKLDRAALPPPSRPDTARPTAASSGATDHEPDAARSETERRVADVMAQALELVEIGPHEDFFALGGDSLRAVQAILQLNTELNREVPINALFEARTAYGLAMLMDGDLTPEPHLGPRAADRPARLSSAQWRLWLHQQRMPDSVADNRVVALRLPERVDHEALDAALSGLLERHEILRTRYEYDAGGQPVPVVLPATTVRLETEEADPAAVLRAELGRPFDLATEAPLRMRLVRSGPGAATVLLLVVHQIAADDWSREVIAKQVRAAYHGRVVSPPALQYADYAEWQRELAAGPNAQRHLDHWRTTLAGLARADLLIDRPRPFSRDFRAATVRFDLAPAVAGALREVAFAHDTTAPVALLAGLYAALVPYTKGSDMTVGVLDPGRRRPELQDLVGMVQDTAVLRAEMGDCPTFEQLLIRVRDAALAAYDHASLPFEDVVAAVLDLVATPPEPGRNPLFDVMFASHAMPVEPDAIAEPELPEIRTDLCCRLVDRPDGGLDGRFEYAMELFDETTITRLAGDYVHLLTAFSQDPARPVEQVVQAVPRGHTFR